MDAAYTVGGVLITAGAIAALVLMAAKGIKLAFDAAVEENRLREKRERLRDKLYLQSRIDKLADQRAKDILRHTVFCWRVRLVDETKGEKA